MKAGIPQHTAALIIRFSAFLYTSFCILLFLIVSLFWDCTEFYLKDTMPPLYMSHLGAMFCAVLLTVIVFRFASRFPDTNRSAISTALLISISSAVLFVWQVLIVRHCWFASGYGDDAIFVLRSALAYARREYQFIENAYLQICSNNITLTGVFGLIMRSVMFLTRSEPSIESFQILLDYIQSFLNMLTCACCASAAYQMTNSRRASFLCWFSVTLTVGLSPYILVPYSDSISLVFPVLIFLLWYAAIKKEQIPLYFLLGLLSGFAFILKPHAFIPAVAALLCLFLRCLSSEFSVKRFACFLAMIFGIYLFVSPVQTLLHNGMHLRIDSEKSLEASQYLNVGLNTQTDGCFIDSDRAFALSWPTKAERNRACLDSAFKRIQEMGPGGMLRHAFRKCLVNFSDGTFSWNNDFNQIVPPPRNALSPILRSIVYEDGEAHRVLATIQQIAWQLVLFLLPFAELARRKASGLKREAIFMLMLSCLGILMFNMLLEAKGRYVYTLVPLFCLLAVCSGEALFLSLKERFRR